MSRFLPFLILLAAGISRAEEPKRFEYEEPHMGTKFRIVLYAPDKSTGDKAAKAAFARVEELNKIMSDYIADSELMKLCKKSEREPAGPVKVSDELFVVLSKAQEISAISEGPST